MKEEIIQRRWRLIDHILCKPASYGNLSHGTPKERGREGDLETRVTATFRDSPKIETPGGSRSVAFVRNGIPGKDEDTDDMGVTQPHKFK